MSSVERASWFEKIPKAELHLHLEGAIPHEALWELIQKYGGDPLVPDFEALERRFQYRDFSYFLAIWTWKNGFLREYEDFAWIATAVARDLAAQNIRYVEAFYSPADFTRYGLGTQGITTAIRRGLDRVPEVRVVLIADLVRDYGPEKGAKTLAELVEVRDQGVIGIGIGGSERTVPPETFREVYESARNSGFRTTAHAGEAAGPESIWGAVRVLEVDRIGHGTRAEEDDTLLEYLAEKEIPLEMCPLSNVRTAIVESLEQHPIRRYVERGLTVTVNTDDPKMFGNSLAGELRALSDVLGFSHGEVRALMLAAVQASWLSEADKSVLQATFTRDPAWSDEED